MTPDEFIRKWQASKLKERSAAQEHFIDLCKLVDHPTPADADPDGDWFTFERGAKKTGGGDGWADVWKRGHFAIEYKGKHKDLDQAFAQLQRYAIALQNPPLLVVCDTDLIRIHTNFTNTVEEIHFIELEHLRDPANLQTLRWMFTDPERLKPGTTRDAVTERAARAYAEIAQSLRKAGHPPDKVAHFVNRLLFCMFAEDIGLLPNELFTRVLEIAASEPSHFVPMLQDLFGNMRKGGNFGADKIEWFNGGLFDNNEALSLDSSGIKQVLKAARMDWDQIEPSIFGTLFERGLDPAKRSQLGAHYTDPVSIMRLIEPVVLAPLRAEWDKAKARIEFELGKEEIAEAKLAQAGFSKDERKTIKTVATKAHNQAQKQYIAFLTRLYAVRILDPACGSGNFLYLALFHLKDLELRVMLEAEALGLERGFPHLGPEVVQGIELNPYAAELARVTVWIGEIQWMMRNGFGFNKKPVLTSLDHIECRDAVLTAEGEAAEWPEADFIIGNPPFLGDKKLIGELGEDYAATLRAAYKGRVPGGADLVTWWFEKAREQIATGKARRAGLVSTNSIRGGKNRKVLERIVADMPIFAAWSDEPWVVDGAAVRVSLIGFGKGEDAPVLDGEVVPRIHADLMAEGADLTEAVQLVENAGVAFQGTVKVGPFDIPGEQAREWLPLPVNPNGCSNADVVRPWANGLDVTRRPRDMWIVDFGINRTEVEAALYEAPFEFVREHVYPVRTALKEDGTPKVRRDGHRRYWWRFGETRSGMRAALAPLGRYIITPRVAKHRLFAWEPFSTLTDSAAVAIARDDDTTFGILHSRFHELWALRMGTSLEDRPRYTPTTTFQTFPFPEGLTPNIPAADYADNPHARAIATAAQRLTELRDNWLNPPEWVRREPEVVAGFPDRLIPVDEAAAKELKKRTLTNLYNQRPAWLQHAHKALDEAVAAAYGWDPDIPDTDVLARLLELNQQRAAK